MSRKNKFKQQQATAHPAVSPKALTPVTPNSSSLQWILMGVVALLAFVLYAQTLRYDYALDDITVITQNKLVQQGTSAIPTLLKTDYWFGYTDQLRGQQYRPLSLVMFAMEYQISPANPAIHHFFNLVLYVLTCSLGFLLLIRLFPSTGLVLPFMAALLFAAHPVHTEVVSNIKSRDELLCFFFGIGAMLTALRYFKRSGIIWIILSGALLLLSLMSKETGIAFLVLIPLTGYFFGNTTLKKIGISTAVLVAFTLLYFLLRNMAVQNIQPMPIDPMDNTLMLAANKSEEWGTAFSVLLRYLGLLLFPFKLSYDYSHPQIPVQSLASGMAIAGVVAYLGLLILAVKGFKQKKIYSWAILFFLLALFPVSNLFLKIGSTMAERFLYIPSFGFCVLLAWAIMRIFRVAQEAGSGKAGPSFSRYAMPLTVVVIIVLVFAGRTITRNKVWENNVTLFESGLKTAPESARVHYNWGTTVLNKLYKESTDPVEKSGYLEAARTSLEKAGSIFPSHDNIQKNRAAVYMNAQQFPQAILALDSVLKRVPNDTTALKNMGRAYGNTRQFAQAANYFEACIRLAPGVAENYQLAGAAYQFMGETQKANAYFEQAKKLP
jgi:hypothetical protein